MGIERIWADDDGRGGTGVGVEGGGGGLFEESAHSVSQSKKNRSYLGPCWWNILEINFLQHISATCDKLFVRSLDTRDGGDKKRCMVEPVERKLMTRNSLDKKSLQESVESLKSCCIACYI